MNKVLTSLLLVACASGCDQDVSDSDSRSAILPLIAVDADGEPMGLVGTFDSETHEVWLTDATVDSAVDLAQEQGATQPRLIVRFDANSVFVNDSVARVGELVEGDVLRACAFDAPTETTWTITDVEVGSASDLDALSSFIPTSLPVEEEPIVVP